MRSATQPYCNTVEYGCVSLRMRFFPQNFGTIKRILPGSSSPSLTAKTEVDTQFDERICKHCQVKGGWERATLFNAME